MSAGLYELLDDHRSEYVGQECIPTDDGRLAWVYARRCDCGWLGPSAQHVAHLADVLTAAGCVQRDDLTSDAAVERAASRSTPPDLWDDDDPVQWEESRGLAISETRHVIEAALAAAAEQGGDQ